MTKPRRGSFKFVSLATALLLLFLCLWTPERSTDNWEAAWAEQLAKRQQRLVEREEMQPINGSISIGPSKRSDKKPISGTHSIHRYIELGLVCDRRFLDFHKGTDYERYLMTIMNMVSDFYHDASCGNQLDPIVVRIIYLEMEKKEIDLQITQDSEKTLQSFATWSAKMNPEDQNHPNHYDIGVLITRLDLCSATSSCDLMGLAYVATACDHKQAAAINEDSGLLLGIVVAHEVGHVMGCAHDELENTGCPPQDKDKSYFVMSPIVFIFTIRWSSCSRKFITSFLESGLGDCLNDNPRNPPDKFKLPNMLPGVMYDGNAQCKFERPGSTLCEISKDKVCKELWCKDGEKCYSKGSAPAEGTKCGEKKWCIQMKCVDMGSRPSAVHGGWGAWGPMGSCSRTCGAGVKYQERECNKPAPANGGRFCLGERKRIVICNTSPCDPKKPPYRAVQCAEFNSKKVGTDSTLHKWTPYIREDLDQCALYCLNEANTFMKLAPVVKDATPCKGGTNNMCVSGSCRKVGCDWVLDSKAVNDKCGVCNGDGTQCTPFEGEYTTKGKTDYQKIVTIPMGARSISIIENAESPNTIAIKYERSNKYCLNGNHVEDRDGDYECAGSMVIYSHPKPQQEEISINGPIDTEIQVQYTFYEPNSNPGVSYKYYMKSSGATGYIPQYHWDFTEWGECSVKCGGGTMMADATCIEEKNGPVSPTYCQNITRPDPKSRICNEKPCVPIWRVSRWSKCSACDGKTGLMHRKVQCVKPAARPGGDPIQSNFEACPGRAPKQQQPCKGTRPCKTMCPKPRRDCSHADGELADPKARERSLTEQRRMIDNFVDVGLARYLQKKRRQTVDEVSKKWLKRDTAEDFKNLLHDWAMLGNEGGGSRACDKIPDDKPSLVASGRIPVSQIVKNPEAQQSMDFNKKFTTPKPGSIIKDIVPPNQIVVYEAPIRNQNVKANLSDVAFQQSGDIIPDGIDTKKQKVYHGADAINLLLGKQRQNANPVDREKAVGNSSLMFVDGDQDSKAVARRPIGKAPTKGDPKLRSYRLD